MRVNNCYINGIGTVSAQALDFDAMKDNPAPLLASNKAVHPSYKEMIPAAMLRRMASGIKMGIFAAHQAIQDANETSVDAIITGTGMGCLQDTEKFLDNMLEQEEMYLSPTSFIQSTHNTVAAQIALHLSNKAYNFTYSNGSNSFEAALFDGMLQIHTLRAKQVLVGGVDELADKFDKLFRLVQQYKKTSDDINFIHPASTGACRAEGANFFLLSGEQTEKSYALLLDVFYFNKPRISLQDEVNDFLNRNQITKADIDILFLGYNADVNQQHWFDAYAVLFPDTMHAYYQHISGSFDTSSAYGLKLAAEILKKQTTPTSISYNHIKPRKLKHILLVNQSNGQDNSLVLIRAC
jgi:hypothetical protein